VRKAFIRLHTAIFLAGFTAILGKLIGLNEGLLVWYRLLLTVIALFFVLSYAKKLVLLPVKDLAGMAGVGCIIAIHWVAFYGSVKYANISVGLVCLSAAGFFTAIFEPLIMKRRIVFVELLLGILAIAGIYVIFDFYPEYKKGILFGVVSAMGSALFPIFNKRLLARFSPRILTFYELAGGFIMLSLLLPLYLYAFPAAYYLPTVQDWIWLLALAILCTVVAFDLQLKALKEISAFTANLSFNLEPVYGIILAFLFFGEGKMLKSGFFLGLTLIMLAVSLQMWRVYSQRKRKGSSEVLDNGIHLGE
jgi:drug/metabolite transporter (DMT)-like permease